jgi:hypothetical protein
MSFWLSGSNYTHMSSSSSRRALPELAPVLLVAVGYPLLLLPLLRV